MCGEREQGWRGGLHGLRWAAREQLFVDFMLHEKRAQQIDHAHGGKVFCQAIEKFALGQNVA